MSEEDVARVKDDDAVTRRERRRQSDYREHVLRVSPGERPGSGPLGNLLPPDDRRSNFLSQEAAGYAEQRVPVVRREGGQLDAVRLFTNMLSSMPLAFNVFGHLRSFPAPSARLLSELVGVELVDLIVVRVGDRLIAGIECEWAPERKRHLNDGTAFDAVVVARSADGARWLIAVEVKYVDKFSIDKKDDRRDEKDAKYRDACTRFGMASGAFDALSGNQTRQLLRNVLLTESVRSSDSAQPSFERALTVVFGRDDDQRARDAVQQVRAQRGSMSTDVRFFGHGELAAAATAIPELADWAAELRRRYVGDAPEPRVL